MSERYTYFNTLINLSTVDNKCKCQILSLIYMYPYTSPALPPAYIYTELAPKLTATAPVAQSVEHWSSDPKLRVRFPVGGLRGLVSVGS